LRAQGEGGEARAVELGRLRPPYGGIEQCAHVDCPHDGALSEEVGVYLYRDLESAKLVVFCGDCARYAEMNAPERFLLVAL
jgi:hypothetical protein